MMDIDSLMPHSQFLFDKLNFLLESTIGFNGLRQNKIIKIFSVAAVVFLPPTLIASIYGMNFQHMPELDWYIGYPLALVLMISSAVSTYFFFKKRKAGSDPADLKKKKTLKFESLLCNRRAI